MCNSGTIERHSLLKAAGAFCGLSTLAVIPGSSQCSSRSTMDSGQMAGRFFRSFN